MFKVRLLTLVKPALIIRVSFNSCCSIYITKFVFLLLVWPVHYFVPVDLDKLLDEFEEKEEGE